MFAYCGNNPIARTDEAGTIWKDVIRLFMHAGNMALVAIGFDTAALGAACLDMKIDSAGVYHAEFDCRQQKFGYNILYDIVFDIGTYMLADFFSFTCDGEGYTIWVWKASYINLGAGAELAIYRGNSGHRTVDKSLAMPMTMTLLYKGETIITHGTYHWWATGFNPNYLNVFASDLTAIFSIYFGNREMFYAFMDKHNKDPRWSFDSNYYKATLQF